MTESLLPQGESVDLTNCDREPIHIPGAIQPHGYLFALRKEDLGILHASENVQDLVGASAQNLIGKRLEDYLHVRPWHAFREWLQQVETQEDAPLGLLATSTGGEQRFHAIAHRTEAGIILELEPVLDEGGPLSGEISSFLQTAIERLQQTADLKGLYQVAVEEIRRITGIDRVMMYRFDPDWHGHVVAEARAEHMDSYHGLHFPASDIPQQARRLYTLNRLRLIANVDYVPSQVFPVLSPVTNAPLDMSFSVLRSVSPIHIEYLKNMEVRASMSISIVKDDVLWGLLACHHSTPLLVPYPVRTACQLLGQVFSMLLAVKQDVEDKAYSIQLQSAQTRLLESMIRADDFVAGLTEYQPNMLELMNATGAAVVRDGEVTLIGMTPEADVVRRLVAWLEQNTEGDIFSTSSLSSVCPEGEPIQEIASGLLAASLSRLRRYYAIWFRPEMPQMVYWAGNPNKAVTTSGDGAEQLHPRKSFEAWKDILRGRAEPWRPGEIEAARLLRASIIDVVLVKAEKLAKLNASLENANQAMGEINDRLRSEIAERKEAEARLARTNLELVQRNRELQHFSFIASHDLQEPLRKVQAFADLLERDYAGAVDEAGRHYLARMKNAAVRMSRLISDILAFSHILTHAEPFVKVDLNQSVSDALFVLRKEIEVTRAEVDVGLFPTIEAEPKQMRRLFENLISNALKFRSELPPRIRVTAVIEEPAGSDDDATSGSRRSLCRIMVEDNGIGFDEKYLDRIFVPFQRLHNRSTYPGTGIGLAICRRIAELHGGTITAQSSPGQGSTFTVCVPVTQPESLAPSVEMASPRQT